MNVEAISAGSLQKAVSLLNEGRLVAFATETVYGLGADAANDRAVAEIFALKGRPQFNPLIVHVDGAGMAGWHGKWNDRAETLSQAFWPGPLTLVLPRMAGSPISWLVSAGGDTLALRCPAHEGARALIAAAGRPLAAPSANRSGRVSPTTARHVVEEFGEDVSLILDAGPCSVGIESTVIDITGEQPVLLRPGFVTKEQLEKTLGEKVLTHAETSGGFRSPGLLLSHYAPSLPVRLNAVEAESKEALLAFGPTVPAGAAKMINLSAAGNLTEAAANLFAGLRALDEPEFTGIAIMPIPEKGIGVAINDRLKRAAAK